MSESEAPPGAAVTELPHRLPTASNTQYSRWMGIAYKLSRIRRLTPALGVLGAAWLELRWTLRSPRIRVWVPELRRHLVVRRFDSDLDVLDEVLVDRECEIALSAAPRIIIDAGANVGYTTAWWASHYPAARVLAIEPDPANCALLRANCRGLANVHLIEGALCPWSGWARIANPEATSWAFRVERCEEHAAGALPAFTVPGALAAVGLEMQPIDLFKCDIEGGETALFSSNADAWLPYVRSIAIETHSAEAREAVTAATAGRFTAREQRGEKAILIATG